MGLASDRFHAELSKLYVAAAEPPLEALVRFGCDQQPPIKFTTSGISDWLTCKTVPAAASRRSFLALVAHLQIKAAEGPERYQPHPPLWWTKLHDDARRERSLKRGGRPRRPRETSLPAAGPVQEAALRSYLAWVVEVTRRVPVRGLRIARGLVEVPLDRVYVALKVDSSSPTERAAASEALRREINARLSEQDLSPEEEDQYRWYLYSDLPVADYFGTTDRFAQHNVEPATVLTIDQLYCQESAAVILGDPGSGKTTIMRWLAMVHAKALLESMPDVRVAPGLVDPSANAANAEVVLGPPLLPILVRIGEYAADRQSRDSRGLPPRPLTEFIGCHAWENRRPVWLSDVAEYRENEQIPEDVLTGLLHEALRRGQSLVVLDGLDEVAAEVREDTAAAVTEFVRTWAGNDTADRAVNRVFVTSRIAGYQLAPLPQHLIRVTVERMTDEALRVFVHNWIGEIATAAPDAGPLLTDPGGVAESLMALVLDPANRHARDLASNPLLAGVIVSVFLNSGASLPPQRVELFQATADALVDVWRRRLGRTFSSLVYQTMLAALPAVAAHVHDTKPNGVITRTEFRKELLREMARIDGEDPDLPNPELRDKVDLLLEAMLSDVGLLVESGPDAFRFSHQTFQEFFAARHLVAEPAQRLDRFLARLSDPRWREPILMGLALANWEHSALVELTRLLLAVDGELAEFFPETALLLAAAVLQITDVPAEAVRLITGRLLSGYSTAAGRRRMPRMGELIQNAVAALRESAHDVEVDAVLVSALTDPGDAGPILACAAAELIRQVGAVGPRLAEALIDATDLWDVPELGHPISVALSHMLPASHPNRNEPSRLPAGWRTGRLKMRDLLRRSPELVQRVLFDPQWHSVLLCLYGGQPDLGAADALDEYYRITNYLQLSQGVRSEFEDYYGYHWGSDNAVHAMAVYLDTVGLHLKKRWKSEPEFVIDGLCRDSPLTVWIGQALHQGDLVDLTGFFGSRLTANSSRDSADAALGLWALGHDVDAFLANGSVAADLASRRISALGVLLRDATIRAAPLAAPALQAAAAVLAPEEWEELRGALTATLMEAGATPISFTDVGALPELLQVGVLAEEFTQKFAGSGDDFIYEAAALADLIGGRRFSAQRLVEALTLRGVNQHSRYRLSGYRWPADPLTFIRHDDALPMEVLDQILRLPAPMYFAPSWIVQDVLAPLTKVDPSLVPEALIVAWSSAHRRKGDTDQTVAALDPGLISTSDPFGYVLRLTRNIENKWQRARALVRLAEVFPAFRSDLLAEALDHAVAVQEPLRVFQLRERFAMLVPTEERAPHIDACLRTIPDIEDHANAARALLRIARFLPAPGCDALAIQAVERARVIEGVRDRLALLRLVVKEYSDRPEVRMAAERAAPEIGGALLRSARPDLVLTKYVRALIGDGNSATQAWTPVMLYARSVEERRRKQAEEVENAWGRLAACPDAAAVNAVLAAYEFDMIECSSAVVRTVTAAATRSPAGELDPILSRLVHLDCAAEPLVMTWLSHDQPRLRQVAALLLAEYRRLDLVLIKPLTELLVDEDDLLRGRARRCLDSTAERDNTHDSVTRLGVSAVDQLAKFAVMHRHDPSTALVITWHFGGLLHDDPTAFVHWCDALEQGQPDADYIVKRLLLTDDHVWLALLDRIANGSPRLQAVLIIACAMTMHTKAMHAQDASLELGSSRWKNLWEVLRESDGASLSKHRVLLGSPSSVLAAVHTALAATDGTLDEDSVGRAVTALWRQCGTDLGSIIGQGTEATVHDQLVRLGSQFFELHSQPDDAMAKYRELSTSTPESNWPWVELLARWADGLLAKSPQDEPGCWERHDVLIATRAVAATNTDNLRELPDAEVFSQRLADGLMFHNSFPGRAAAANLLGLLRIGSRPVLRALEHGLRDVPTVRAAARQSFSALRNIDSDLVDDLAAALTGPSSIAAWSSAQLLSIIGKKATITPALRSRIIDFLANAAHDPRSRRTVHFSYTTTPIPTLPELDDVIAEALRRVYRIG